MCGRVLLVCGMLDRKAQTYRQTERVCVCVVCVGVSVSQDTHKAGIVASTDAGDNAHSGSIIRLSEQMSNHTHLR